MGGDNQGTRGTVAILGENRREVCVSLRKTLEIFGTDLRIDAGLH